MFSRKLILSAVVAAVAMAPSLASAATNLIANGDFSAGFDGSFTTGYTQVAPSTNIMYNEGNITIAANPFSVHDLWVPIAGSNAMLIANGSPTSGLTIWQESAIAVTSGAKYNFGANVMNVCCNDNFHGSNAASTIIFQVSTTGLDGSWTNLTQYTTVPGDPGVLNPLTALYTASSSQVYLRAVNPVDATSGNDFALDDLTFASAVPEPSTWAMFFLGFGAIGLMMRRRQARGLALAA